MCYRKLQKVTILVTFRISCLWGSLLSRGRYFRGIVTFEGSLLSGGCYFRGVITFEGSLLSVFFSFWGARYFRGIVIFEGSLLSGVISFWGGRYFRGGLFFLGGVVTFEGSLLSRGCYFVGEARYFRGVVTFVGSLLSGSKKRHMNLVQRSSLLRNKGVKFHMPHPLEQMGWVLQINQINVYEIKRNISVPLFDHHKFTRSVTPSHDSTRH